MAGDAVRSYGPMKPSMPATTATPNPAANLFLPEGAALPTRLRVAWSALKVLEKDAGNTIAGPLLNACLDGGVYAELSQELVRTDAGRELLTERPTLQASDIDLQALARLPEGTLGHAFARYFEDNKISPFESPFEVRNDVDYLSKRYRETHDIAHVLTGYGTDIVGEMELQAFMLGNLGIRTAALILTFSTLRQIPREKGVSARDYSRRLWAAYRRGARSQQLIRVRYERYWETPVQVLRDQLCA
jgi:ubiquinone biosynthesis protein COQ4